MIGMRRRAGCDPDERHELIWVAYSSRALFVPGRYTFASGFRPCLPRPPARRCAGPDPWAQVTRGRRRCGLLAPAARRPPRFCPLGHGLAPGVPHRPRSSTRSPSAGLVHAKRAPAGGRPGEASSKRRRRIAQGGPPEGQRRAREPIIRPTSRQRRAPPSHCDSRSSRRFPRPPLQSSGTPRRSCR